MGQDRGALLDLCATIIDKLVSDGLTTIVMARSTKVDTTLTAVASTMEQLRDRRLSVVAELDKLDAALVALGGLATLLGADDPTDAASDLTEAVSMGGKPEAQIEDVPSQVEQLSRPKRRARNRSALPVYRFHEKCWKYHTHWDQPCETAFEAEELNEKHGTGGWIGRDWQITMEEVRRAAARLGVKRAIPVERQPEPGPEPTQAIKETKTKESPARLRPGSKNHRIFEATKHLLQKNAPQHIDSILDGIQAEEPHIFDSVGDARMNLSNILSLLKSRRLLASDHRGYWWLPNGRDAS